MIDEIDRFFGPAESPEAGCNAGSQETTSVASQFLCEMAKYQENKGIVKPQKSENFNNEILEIFFTFDS